MILDRWLSHPNNVPVRAHVGLSPHACRMVFAQLGEFGPTEYNICRVEICHLSMLLAEDLQVSLEKIRK